MGRSMSKEDDYIGSERHFRDIQAAAGKATSDQLHPETLSEALSDFCGAWDDLMKALGFYRLSVRAFFLLEKF